MKVQAQSESGLVYGVIVRWSRAIQGLYTTRSMLRQCLKGRDVKLDYASAPFTVYRGDWNNFGLEEDKDFFAESNVDSRVPYVDSNWNYK